MARLLRRPTLSATGTGIGAGAAMLAVLCADAVSRGESAYTPFSLSASVVLGEAAAHSEEPLTILVGLVVGTLASVLYGFFFSQLSRALPEPPGRGWGRQLLVGAAFGAAMYVVAFQVVARIAFPWLLSAEPLTWFFAHAVVYGPLLAVMYEVGLRRERDRIGFLDFYG
jgi:hypothetical protein